MAFINFNGKLLDQDSPIIRANNRGLRYGDGLFETLKMERGKIRHWDLHMTRLFSGLAALKFVCPKLFTPEFLWTELSRTAEKNKVSKRGRIRLTLIRGNGGLFDPENLQPNYIIEATELPEQYFRFNENGLVIDVFPDARKSCDAYSSLKHNNYLPYVMAALYAKEHQLNDCLLLNQYNRICDSTIANLFWVKDSQVYTNPISEGPVAGTMRQFLLNRLAEEGNPVIEAITSPDELLSADELFLTNAAYGIRWVGRFRDKIYSNQTSSKIYSQYVQTKE